MSIVNNNKYMGDFLVFLHNKSRLRRSGKPAENVRFELSKNFYYSYEFPAPPSLILKYHYAALFVNTRFRKINH